MWAVSQEAACKWASLRCQKAHFVWCKTQWRSFCCGAGAEPCLDAEQVLAVRKSGRFAWVEFSTIQAAHQALQLDGEPLGTGMLKISQSKTPIHTAGWRAPVRLLCVAHCPSAALPGGVPGVPGSAGRQGPVPSAFGYAPRWAMPQLLAPWGSEDTAGQNLSCCQLHLSRAVLVTVHVL